MVEVISAHANDLAWHDWWQKFHIRERVCLAGFFPLSHDIACNQANRLFGNNTLKNFRMRRAGDFFF
jgi:hypothetical protein